MPTITQLQTALADTPNLSELAQLKGQIASVRLMAETSAHIECDKTTLGELARALQVETRWNGRTYSLTIENGTHTVILQTPVNVNATNTIDLRNWNDPEMRIDKAFEYFKEQGYTVIK